MSASQTGVLAAAVLADPPEGLVRLGSIDALIVTLYFAMVIGIGFYLKPYETTGEDFFLADRDMSSWIAGLSFVAANLGTLELMGWASAAYQYGILATHWY
jgi:solute:Na+ symporter, SSS family